MSMPSPSTTKINSEFTAPDLQGTVRLWWQYIQETLGFEQIGSCQILVKHDGFQVLLDADDKFQSKRSYSDRIGSLNIFEYGRELDTLINETWRQLTSHMLRDERELRFGMAALGDAIEGDQLETAIGRLVAERIKAVREELSQHLLAGPRREVPEPQQGPTEFPEDDIPF